jgi:polyisoprenoid-binding protein YceI
MKKITSTVLAMAFGLLLIAGEAEKKTYKVDTKVSSVEWIGEKVTGTHTGTISVKEGNVILEGENIVGGSISIDMNSIVVTDIEDEGTNAKLKGHLMSDDFFGVKNHALASLKISSSKHVEGKKHIIMGDITIKGKTEKIEIPVTVMTLDTKVVIIGEAKIDRTKFDIRYGSGQFFEDLGDRMISDDFTIKFKVGAK